MSELIAFEGKDGVGKTELAERFANNNNFKHETQRIIGLLNSDDNSYRNFVRHIRNSENEKLAPVFYFFKCMLDREAMDDTVVERTMASVYYFEKEKFKKEEWDFFMKLGVIPDLTFLLYASPEVRRKRIENRNPLDPDLEVAEIFKDDYYKMINFMNEYNFPFVFLDTESLTIDSEEKLCSSIYKDYKSISEYSEKLSYLDELNCKYGMYDYLPKGKCLSLKVANR